ncbi:MAG: tripartite tricarboxylate transporter TctB family protein [Desulfitobacteriaceae bacterium]
MNNLRLADRSRYGEIGISIFMAVLAITFYVFATFTQSVNPVDPGPAFFPRLISVILFVLCLVQLVSSFKGKPLVKKIEGDPESSKNIALYVIGTILLAIVYVLVFTVANYIITTTLFLGVLMFAIGVRKWSTLIAVSIIYSVATYFLYSYVLLVQLP